jgi:response regulator NasT
MMSVEGGVVAGRERDPESLPESPERILVAEDEHLVAAEVVAVLGGLGFSAVHAADGGSAVELARTASPDLAIVDIRMPNGDGLWAASELYREMGIPVVLLTAYCDEELIRGAQEAGVFGYVMKPASAEQVRAAVAVAWRRYRMCCAQRAENRELQRRLAERRTIEQAKWALVSSMGITEPEAMKLLQKRARDSRRGLAEVAAEVLGGNG